MPVSASALTTWSCIGRSSARNFYRDTAATGEPILGRLSILPDLKFVVTRPILLPDASTSALDDESGDIPRRRGQHSPAPARLVLYRKRVLKGCGTLLGAGDFHFVQRTTHPYATR